MTKIQLTQEQMDEIVLSNSCGQEALDVTVEPKGEGVKALKEFFDVYERHHLKLGFKLEIYHTSIMDWCINIGYKSTHPKCDETIIQIQDCDYELAFAKAQVQLKEWLTENSGGY